MTDTYDVGDNVTLNASFTLDNVLTDPTTVTLTLQDPLGVETTYVYGVDVEVVRDSAGVYHAVVIPATAGLWRLRWAGSGNLAAVLTDAFYTRTTFSTALDPFATVVELAAYLQTEIDDSNEFALFALDAAANLIRKYCGQYFSIVLDEDTVIDGSGTDVVLLPETPVIDVASVSNVLNDTDYDTEDFVWTRDSGLLVRRGGSWPLARQALEVTYSHGYESVPQDIRLLSVVIAGRAWAQDGALTEGIGEGSMWKYAGQPAVLTKDEKAFLDRYRVRYRR